MAKKRTRPMGEHPEIFWILFVLASAGVFAAVVEPARQDAEEVRRRVEATRAEIAARRERLVRKRRERQALESGDPDAWTAACYLNGILLPGSCPAGGRSGRSPRGQR